MERSLREKSRLRETRNLSNDADSITDIFVSAGVKKGANSIFFLGGGPTNGRPGSDHVIGGPMGGLEKNYMGRGQIYRYIYIN